MESLPLLLLGCLAGLSVPWLVSRKRPRASLPSSALLDDELGRLHEGSVIVHDSVEYVVTRAGRLALAGPWQQVLLLDSPQGQALLLLAAAGRVERLWLLQLRSLRSVVPPGITAAADELQVDARRYRLSGRYVARLSFDGAHSEETRIDSYVGMGAHRLLLFRSVAAALGQAFVGQVVSPDSLRLLPTGSLGANGADR